MELCAGEAALTAARPILDGCPVPAVAVDPYAMRGESPAVVAVASGQKVVVADARTSGALLQLISEAQKPLAAEDGKAVCLALIRAGGAPPARFACARLSALLLACGRPVDPSLEALCRTHGVAAPPPADAGLAELGRRAQLLALLVEKLVPAIKQAEMVWVSRIEAAAITPVAQMEQRGMPFDASCWRALAERTREERVSLETRLRTELRSVCDRDLFGEASINLDSDADLKAALGAAGLAVPDVRRQTLAKLAPPLGPLLYRFRELGKLTASYGEAFLEHVGKDGRIHPVFEQIGASTGRMACHSPNLQAVVKDVEHRGCFRVAEHRRLVIGDYAACELRILAEMSGDPVFAEAFARGEDLHARVASAVFGKPVSKRENPELRERAKAINFGLAYGMGAGGLAAQIGTDVDTARGLLERYFMSFPRIRSFLENSAREALARGFARTLTGRRLDLDVGPDRASRAQAERIAKNMPIQGTSADITKIALARLWRRLHDVNDAWIVNAVHDEIVVECNAPDAEKVRTLLTEEMVAAGGEVLHNIPLAVDTGVCSSWEK